MIACQQETLVLSLNNQVQEREGDNVILYKVKEITIALNLLKLNNIGLKEATRRRQIKVLKNGILSWSDTFHGLFRFFIYKILISLKKEIVFS